MISAGHYGNLFSPPAEPSTLRLQPGEKFVAPVSFFATVPEDKRLPGSYTVQAVYEYGGTRAVSEPLTVRI